MSKHAGLDRRRLLLGLGAAATAAAATAAAPPAIALTTVDENPELIRLAAELPALEDQYEAARKHQDFVLRKWRPQWPLAPDEITRPGSRGSWGGDERTFEGGALVREGEECSRQLITSDETSRRVKHARSILKGTKLVKGRVNDMDRQEWEAELAEAEHLHAIAVRYELEIERITKDANYAAAWKTVDAATKNLAHHIAAIMARADWTVAGLMIKAEALASWGRIHPRDRMWELLTPQQWHGQIAASVLRYADGSADLRDAGRLA